MNTSVLHLFVAAVAASLAIFGNSIASALLAAVCFWLYIYFAHTCAHFVSWEYWLQNHDSHTVEANRMIGRYFNGR